MQRELDLLLEVLGDVKCEESAFGSVYTASMQGHSVMVRKCGIGKVNAAVGALDLINTFCPDVVINTGVAGGTGHAAHVLDVVLASGVAYHDTWCGPARRGVPSKGCPTCSALRKMLSRWLIRLEQRPALWPAATSS